MTGLPTRLFINGEPSRSTDGETIPQINPATEEFLAEVAAASLGDVHTAVKGAHRAFERGWRDEDAADRAEVLRQVGQVLRENVETLARLECLNVGKPITAAREEVLLGARIFDYYAGAIAHSSGQTIPVAGGGLDFSIHVPMGVVAVIVAWTYPLLHACAKSAPALAAGNTVVLKPASRSPLSAILLGQLAHQAGLPAGVLQVVPGTGREIGDALVAHPQIRKITFTGSTEIGSRLMALAARDLKRVSLELGGKSPGIVFPDADVEAAAAAAAARTFANAGQDNARPSRLLVESTVFDRFVERFVEATRGLVVGDPGDRQTFMGPLISSEQRETVEGCLEEIRKQKRRVALSGARHFEKGFFLGPSIVLDVETTDRVWTEEIFGPVVAVRAFDTESELVAQANDTPYGLGAAVWTQDLNRAWRMARQLDCGVVTINSFKSRHIEAPFSGSKHSGVGHHCGIDALRDFTEVKNIFMAQCNPPPESHEPPR